MNFLALLPIFGTLIDRIFPDKEKQDAAKLELQKVLSDVSVRQAEADASKAKAEAESNANIIASKSQVVMAEANSESYAARNWRPHLMYVIMILLIYNYMIAPIVQSMGVQLLITPISNDMWTLLQIGVGGYIVGRSSERIAESFNQNKFYATLHASGVKMSQAQVDNLNKAIEAGKVRDV